MYSDIEIKEDLSQSKNIVFAYSIDTNSNKEYVIIDDAENIRELLEQDAQKLDPYVATSGSFLQSVLNLSPISSMEWKRMVKLCIKDVKQRGDLAISHKDFLNRHRKYGNPITCIPIHYLHIMPFESIKNLPRWIRSIIGI